MLQGSVARRISRGVSRRRDAYARYCRQNSAWPDRPPDSYPGYFRLRTIRRQGVAADGSRRILGAANLAPTAVGGYAGMKCPGYGTTTAR